VKVAVRQALINRVNATIVTCGDHSSGKTLTILGKEDQEGLIELAI
jgi:hypothetical protein